MVNPIEKKAFEDEIRAGIIEVGRALATPKISDTIKANDVSMEENTFVSSSTLASRILHGRPYVGVSIKPDSIHSHLDQVSSTATLETLAIGAFKARVSVFPVMDEQHCLRQLRFDSTADIAHAINAISPMGRKKIDIPGERKVRSGHSIGPI